MSMDELNCMGTDFVQKIDTSTSRKRAVGNALIDKRDKIEDFNLKYQKLLAQSPSSDEAYLKRDLSIVEVVGSFKETVELQVKKSIDSFHVSKTTPYIFNIGNISYEFLVNYQTASKIELESKHKLHNHELQALSHLYSQGEDPHTLLRCIIDYKGFRVIATAQPQSHQLEQVYNIEIDVPLLDSDVNAFLVKKGKTLNMKAHVVMLKNDGKYTISTGAGVLGMRDRGLNLVYLSNVEGILPVETSGDVFSVARRLRSEFLRQYPHALSSDTFREWSSAAQDDKHRDEDALINAGRYLLEVWIPAFVKRCDGGVLRFNGIRDAMHHHGINMRFLGVVAALSKVVSVRDMCVVEMIARSAKGIFAGRIRSAVLHFKNVGATVIDDEMKSYASTLFTLVLGVNEKSYKFWEEKLKEEVKRKFNYTLEFNQMTAMTRPSLFLALQHHCGVSFEDDTDYDFTQTIPTSKITAFTSKTKTNWQSQPLCVDLTSTSPTSELPLEEIVAFRLARHFKLLGNTAKYSKSDCSARALIDVAAYYNALGRYEEARMYAKSACNAALSNSSTHGLAQAQLMVSLSGCQDTANADPSLDILSLYTSALAQIEWEMGKDHLSSLALYDRMCFIYGRCRKPELALKYMRQSLLICVGSLGKSHLVTAGYKVKTAILMAALKMFDEAYVQLGEALHVFGSIKADPEIIAEAHFHLAGILFEKGDVDGAISHSRICKKLRESAFGQQDARTVEVYVQLSGFVVKPFVDHKGVVTDKIRLAYKEIIGCDEKVFRYLKALNAASNASLSSKTTLGTHGSSRSVSNMSIASSSRSMRTSATQRYNQEPHSHIQPVSGPFFTSPYTIPTALHKNHLHKLTKQIIRLKVEMLDQPDQKETVRKLRLANSSGDRGVCPGEARKVIMRLVAVSPSVYMDGIMERCGDADEEAIDELRVLLQLTESDVVGVQNSAI